MNEKLNMNEEIREKIFALADKKYKEFHSGLCPKTDNIVGVRVPILRNYAKEIVKKDFKEYLNNAEDKYYEEVMLQGMVIGIAKMDIDERLSYLDKFIPKIDNWAVCDVTCAGLKFTIKNRKIVWEFLEKYLFSKKEFEIRFAVVMLLNFYIIDDYVDKVIEKIEQIYIKDYYVQMAVAWLISVIYIKYPDKTINYLKKSNLDDFTFNKSLQKIIESYRVSNEEKDNIKNMKRKQKT